MVLGGDQYTQDLYNYSEGRIIAMMIPEIREGGIYISTFRLARLHVVKLILSGKA